MNLDNTAADLTRSLAAAWKKNDELSAQLANALNQIQFYAMDQTLLIERAERAEQALAAARG